jgi:hypothetical protein
MPRRLKENITASPQGRDAFAVSTFMTKVKKDTPMIIKLTSDIEQALAKEAHKLGTTPEQLALDSLRQCFVGREPPYPRQKNLKRWLTFSGGILGFCTAVNTPLVERGCQKSVGKSSQLDC